MKQALLYICILTFLGRASAQGDFLSEFNANVLGGECMPHGASAACIREERTLTWNHICFAQGTQCPTASHPLLARLRPPPRPRPLPLHPHPHQLRW